MTSLASIAITAGGRTTAVQLGRPGPQGPIGPTGVTANWRGRWVAGTTYSAGPPPDGVIASNGQWYISLTSSNVGHDPVTDGGVNWSALPGGPDGTDLGSGFDIWLLIGQSETGAGNNATPDTTHYDLADPRVRQYGSLGTYANAISVAVEPLANNYATNLGLSPMTAFMLRYTRWVAENRRVLIVPCGVGGTGFAPTDPSWTASVRGSLVDFTLTQVAAALAAADGTSRVVGAVWIQGQANNSISQADYSTDLYALVDYLRAQLNPNLVFLIAQMDPDWIVNHPPNGAYVDAAQVRLPADRYLTAYTDSPAGMSIETVGPTHVNAAGQRIRGRRLFDAWLRAISNTASSQPGVPGAITLTQTGTSLAATWVRSLGHITGYKVELQHNGGAWVDKGHSDLTNFQTFTSLTLGDTYTVRVSSLQSAVQSAPSVSATFTMALVPAQVTGLTAATPSANEIDPSWTAVSGATSYLVEYKATSSGTWLTWATTTAVSTAITGLLYSTSYDVRVSAIDAAGTGAPSATLTKTTAALAGPFDVIAATPLSVCAFSVARVLKASWLGAPNLIRVRRSSDNTEQDIGQVAGQLDTAALLSFVGGGDGFVTTIYNQLGGGNPDLAQSTAAKQPKIVSAGVLNTTGPNSQPCAVFNGTSSLMFHSSPGLFAQNTSGYTCAIVCNPSNLAVATIVGESHNANADAFAFILKNAGASNQRDACDIRNDAGTVMVTNSGSTVITGALHELMLTDSGSSLIHYVDNATNGGTYSYTRSGAFTLDRFTIGGGMRNVEDSWSAMSFCEIVSWASVISSGDRGTVHANHQSFYGTP